MSQFCIMLKDFVSILKIDSVKDENGIQECNQDYYFIRNHELSLISIKSQLWRIKVG